MTVYWPKDAEISAGPTAQIKLRAVRTACRQIQTCGQELALMEQIRQLESIRAISAEEMALLQLVRQQLKELQQ